MRIEKENIHENKVLCSNTLQITLDDDFNVPDTRDDIDRIVRQKGNICIDSVKVSQDRAEVSGKMDFAILYIGGNQNEEGVKCPVKMSGSMDIHENINLSCECDGAEVSCDARIEDLTVKTIHSRKISVKAIVSITVKCEEIADTMIGCNVEDEDEKDVIQIKTKPVEYAQLAVNMKDNLRVKETFSLPAAKPEVGEILWEDIDVRSFSTRITDDGIDINGELDIFIMYQPVGDNVMSQWYETTAGFNGKLDLNGCNPEMVSYVKYSVMSVNTEAKPDYDGEVRDIQAEVVLDLDVNVYEECKKNILTDVYSPVKCVANEVKNAEFRKLIIRNNTKTRAADRIKTGEFVNIMQICNCTGIAQIDDISVEEDGLVADGAVIADVFYITADDNEPMGSMRLTVPFSSKIQMNINDKVDADKIQYMVNSYVEQLTAAMTGRNEIEIKAAVSLDTLCFELCEVSSVMNCEINDFDENEYLAFPEMVGYIAQKEENLWDIAKKYHTTIKSIKNINHNIADRGSEKLRKGDKILLVKTAR